MYIKITAINVNEQLIPLIRLKGPLINAKGPLINAKGPLIKCKLT